MSRLIQGPDANTTLDTEIATAAQANGLSPALLKGLVKIESGFNPNATSSVGAKGLTQLMPATAASVGVTNITDPQQNLNGGAKYLKQLIDSHNGNVTEALREYNGGGNWKKIPSTAIYARSVEAAAKLYGWDGKSADGGNSKILGTTIIGDSVDAVSGAVGDAADMAGSVVKLIGTVLSADFWFRFGKGLLGGIALLLGVWALFEMYIKSDGTSRPAAILPKAP